MQPQPISPYAEAGPEHAMGAEEHGEDSPGKKSMMQKVKAKAKKLKTKIKKPKSPGAAHDSNESSSGASEDESAGSEQVGDHSEEREEVVTPGLQGAAFEAIPDPHASGVEQDFGHMSLGDKHEAVPSAPGQASAGVTPYLASHNLGESPYASEAFRGVPVEEGKNVEGMDLLATPTPTDTQGTTAMDYEKNPEVSKTSDNTAAWYTPSEDKASKEGKDHVAEGLTATAAAGAGALGVKSLEDHKMDENKDADGSGGKKGMLEQAKERIFGASTKKVEGEEEQRQTSGSSPTMTAKAASFKDSIAAKLGYGSNKNLKPEGDNSTGALQGDAHDGEENKSVLQKIQESAAGVTGAVTSKVGSGDKALETPSQGECEVGAPGENKTYTQKAYDAAYGAKDAVATKLGYGGTAASTETPTTQAGEQKSYLQGAKEAVTSKLGYGNRDLPASTEGAYSDEQNVPASTAARFHPGEEDRALSQFITDKMSTGATTVKDTLMRPFGASKSGPPTPTTTPPPSSAAAVAEDPIHNTVSGTHDSVEKPGIVGKVTGAMSSLLGTSGSGKKREEVTSKADEDSQAAGVCNVQMR